MAKRGPTSSIGSNRPTLKKTKSSIDNLEKARFDTSSAVEPKHSQAPTINSETLGMPAMASHAKTPAKDLLPNSRSSEFNKREKSTASTRSVTNDNKKVPTLSIANSSAVHYADRPKREQNSKISVVKPPAPKPPPASKSPLAFRSPPATEAPPAFKSSIVKASPADMEPKLRNDTSSQPANDNSGMVLPSNSTP